MINDEDYKFEIGKGKVLREGTDVAIITTDLCVAEALEASKRNWRGRNQCKVDQMATDKTAG